MPDAHGNFKGTGYSAKAAEAWERIFGRPEPAPPTDEVIPRKRRAPEAD